MKTDEALRELRSEKALASVLFAHEIFNELARFDPISATELELFLLDVPSPNEHWACRRFVVRTINAFLVSRQPLFLPDDLFGELVRDCCIEHLADETPFDEDDDTITWSSISPIQRLNTVHLLLGFAAPFILTEYAERGDPPDESDLQAGTNPLAESGEWRLFFFFDHHCRVFREGPAQAPPKGSVAAAWPSYGLSESRAGWATLTLGSRGEVEALLEACRGSTDPLDQEFYDAKDALLGHFDYLVQEELGKVKAEQERKAEERRRCIEAEQQALELERSTRQSARIMSRQTRQAARQEEQLRQAGSVRALRARQREERLVEREIELQRAQRQAEINRARLEARERNKALGITPKPKRKPRTPPVMALRERPKRDRKFLFSDDFVDYSD
ncbi:Protein TolA [Carpediemonas membranifera]|uniref:Protein TolA n=1 Tax=Carpediemonas membranifera TaxID=201153 RepID=A0A8J6B4Z2_9EUKA|nr:Protein TolA [Carpediemonas membranifera]|eukprot:KAG9393119.1 Protein TolA [Carpediemonas membranifera]